MKIIYTRRHEKASFVFTQAKLQVFYFSHLTRILNNKLYLNIYQYV
jgi:hypothetical protein